MKVLVAGDYCPCGRVAAAIERKEYSTVFNQVREITSEADYSIVNLECPVASSDSTPIEKQGTNLKCTPESIEAIEFAGFKCVTLANNHFLDYGEDGVFQTFLSLGNRGIDYVGGGKDIHEASRVLYKAINGQTIAIINCCEHEFSIATETTAGSNPLNPITQYHSIVEARRNADYVLVIVHGGHEYYQLPSPRMIETYRFFIEVGADAVVNHHQHCFSGFEIYREKPIFYGLGNFCFDDPSNRNGTWTEGYAVMFSFLKQGIHFSLFPYHQCARDANVELLPPEAFDEKLCELNSIIANPLALQKEINSYYASCSERYSEIFEPVRNRFYHAAKRRGWLPSLIKKKDKLLAANYVLCESHKDKLCFWLETRNL